MKGAFKMDMIKMGRFLSELRKENNYTQAQLVEKLGVTNKTISRWETGTYMPPVEMLQILSDMYNISINEIISGERLSIEEYKTKAEENIKSVLGESAFTWKDRVVFFKKKWRKEHIFEGIVAIVIMVAMLVFGFVLDNGLQFVAIVAMLGWNVVQYNRMMAFDEENAYGNRP